MKREEAIEIARKLYNDSLFLKKDKEAMATLIPELTESDSERVREAIISGMNALKKQGKETFAAIHINDCIAWLEKQGKKASDKIVEKARTEKQRVLLTETNGDANIDWDTRSIQDAKLLLEYGLDYIKKLEKKGEQKPFDKVEPKFKVGDVMRTLQEAVDGYTDGMPVVISVDKEYYHCTNELIAIKDQDNYEYPPMNRTQTPANKIEPKFHEGEWIVQENIGVYKVIKIYKSWYEVIDGEDNHYSISFDKEHMCHLWDITKDAKDGDVLTTDLVHFILKSKDDMSCYMYCNYSVASNNFDTSNTAIVNSEYVHPATKEQRDLFEKAMADAGYSFDFEKKELKIAQNPTWSDENRMHNLTDFERTLADICIGWIGEELGWEQYIKDKADVLLQIAVKKFNSVQDAPFEQKSAWSEEDEKTLNEIFSVAARASLRKSTLFGKSYDYIKWQNWLKSLKERVQPKNI